MLHTVTNPNLQPGIAVSLLCKNLLIGIAIPFAGLVKPCANKRPRSLNFFRFMVHPLVCQISRCRLDIFSFPRTSQDLAGFLFCLCLAESWVSSASGAFTVCLYTTVKGESLEMLMRHRDCCWLLNILPKVWV